MRERGWAPEKTDLGVAAGAIEGKARDAGSTQQSRGRVEENEKEELGFSPNFGRARGLEGLGIRE